ncbi:MAG: hypothetical protein JRJ84_00925 [Deltaproteobacteria bacterium]|nr:hypothetical protein [Deltaproteobacteria bacterium]
MADNTTNRSTLHWDPEIGFELDVDINADDVLIRMVRVPVPADGTLRLRESPPVKLFALDTLFKSQVDVEGAPGQINDVSVRVVGDDTEELALQATVEDAETGETRSLDVRLPLCMPGEAPGSGGPFPNPPDEDELDWEDEETLDRLVNTAPEPVPTPLDDGNGEDVNDVLDAAGGGSEGLEMLLRALLDPSGTPPIESEEKESAPPDLPAGPAPDAEGSMLMSSEQEAWTFIQLLIDQEHLEMVEGARPADLAPEMARLLALQTKTEAKAAAIANWLLGHPAVEELYIDDDSLAELIERW